MCTGSWYGLQCYLTFDTLLSYVLSILGLTTGLAQLSWADHLVTYYKECQRHFT